jgi:perosamine synthetase
MIPISKPVIEKEEIEAVIKVLKSGDLVQGSNVKEFEYRFSNYIGMDYGIATSSGTTALQIGLEALGIKKWDEVITTPFSFIASSTAIIYNQAKPVFVDIDPETFNIDPEKIQEKITNKTRALLIVHLYGNPCNMDKIMSICKDYDLKLIEDCAQAVGATYKNRMVGSFGDISCFSFYATKNLITGEGGMILTNNKDVKKKAEILRNHGQIRVYEHEIIGYNYRMTNFAAAMGLAQLKKLDRLNKKRIKHAKILTSGLSHINSIKLPRVDKNTKHVFHQYTIKCKKRDRVLNYLNKHGIEARIYYPKPIYMQSPFQRMGFKKGLCPVSEDVCKQVLSLPVHPLLTQKNLETIIKRVKEAI